MKEFYYSDGNVQFGPYDLDQLKTKGLKKETLVWHDGLNDWQPLSSLPELSEQLRIGKIPPPLPSSVSTSKMEITGNVKVTTEKVPNAALEAITPSRKTLSNLIAWCGFHLFAVLMSYSRIDIFNATGEPRTDKFWPFVSFTKTYPVYDSNPGSIHYQIGEQTNFYGLFTQYDLTEFAFYVGGALLLYLFLRISIKAQPQAAVDQGNSTQFENRVKTPEGDVIEFSNIVNGYVGANVVINEKIPIDGDYYWTVNPAEYGGGLKMFTVQQGTVMALKHVTWHRNYMLVQSDFETPRTGDRIFTKDRKPLKSGIYTLGLFASPIFVEDGIIVKANRP
jgi:hypothetical protein